MYLNIDCSQRELLRSANAAADAEQRDAATREWEDRTADELQAYMDYLVSLLDRRVHAARLTP